MSSRTFFFFYKKGTEHRDIFTIPFISNLPIGWETEFHTRIILHSLILLCLGGIEQAIRCGAPSFHGDI
jgi:hypothetical protein